MLPFLIFLCFFGLTPSQTSLFRGPCADGFFECPISGECIRQSQVCDGTPDCPTASDEEESLCHESRSTNVTVESPEKKQPKAVEKALTIPLVGPFQPCPADYFRCENGRCIQDSFLCDGENDCLDGSDERNCGQNFTCPEGSIHCGGAICVLQEWICDGFPDCPDARDEANCTCDEHSFRCKSTHLCIPGRWRCDGDNDCRDGSDEEGCDADIIRMTMYNECTFHCKTGGKCLPARYVCDGLRHCSDGSDEGGQCVNATTQCDNSTLNCSHACHPSPEGPKCYCNDGFRLVEGGACEDINECNELGVCSQVCYNLPGNFSCHCVGGYELSKENNRTCLAVGPEPVLLFSTQRSIRGYHIRSGEYSEMYSGLSQVVGLAYDAIEERIYWSDTMQDFEAVYQGHMKGTSRPMVIASDLSMPEGLAVDHIARHVYIMDARVNNVTKRQATDASSVEEPPRLLVCALDGSSCGVLIGPNFLDKPRALVLFPPRGLMFWSDWGDHPKIVRSGMDGRGIRPIVVDNIKWPNGLALDTVRQELFWADAFTKLIEAVKLDGSERRVIDNIGSAHPFALAVFEDTLFWSDWKQREIISVNKYNGKNKKVLVKGIQDNPMGLQIVHPEIQRPDRNPCWDSSCSHMCLLGEDQTSRCFCPLGMHMRSGDRTCTVLNEKPPDRLVLSMGKRLMSLTPLHISRDHLQTYSHGFLRIGAMAYWQKGDALIVSDVMLDRIFWVSLRNQSQAVLARDHMGSVEGMAVDPIGDNLYWTDAERGTVEVLSLENGARKVLIQSLGQPMSLALEPSKGYLFLTIRDDSHSHIDRFSMAGGAQQHLVEIGVQYPVSIVSDGWMHRIFWTDSEAGTIETCLWDGTDRRVFEHDISQPYGLAILGATIYWTDMHGRDLHWSNKYSLHMTFRGKRSKSMVIVSEESNTKVMMALTSVSTEDIYAGVTNATKHPCFSNRGGCSHLCLVANSTQRTCGCPDGMRLGIDRITCTQEQNCRPQEFPCKDGLCIPLSWKCDGTADCLGGEDEDCNGTSAQAVCADSKHHRPCKNFGGCIPAAWWCDGKPECPDGSDEEDCPPEAERCPEDKFSCADKSRCLPQVFRCDGENDCMDASDERGCDDPSRCKDNFRCGSGQCVPMSAVCDGFTDCRDSSDERNCAKACSNAEFTCHALDDDDPVICLSPSLVCNGNEDCPDGADEKGCPSIKEETFENKTRCAEGQYQCRMGDVCIPQEDVCDGVANCPTGDDEFGCCLPQEYLCDGGRCIHQSYVCDGQKDCPDGSDESKLMCGPKNADDEDNKKSCEDPTTYRCLSGECLPLSLVCNGLPDCADASDEGGRCNTSCLAKHHPCIQKCNPTPRGYQCTCTDGYELDPLVPGVCRDVDECDSTNSPCAQLCYNEKGSFKCGCADGYLLDDDRRTCRADGPPAKLVLAFSSHIEYMSIDGKYIQAVPLKGHGTNITSVSYDAEHSKLFWTDATHGTVTSFSEEAAGNDIKVELLGLLQPGNLAYDWVSGNFYLTEQPLAGRTRIVVCRPSAGPKQKSPVCVRVHDLGRHYIGGLAVHPPSHKLFYGAWTAGSHDLSPWGTMIRSGLDGSHVYYIVREKIGQPIGLALDIVRERIFWTDVHKQSIESCDWFGNFRTIHEFRKVDLPFHVAVFESRVFWTEPESQELKEADRRKIKSQIIRRKVDPRALIVKHPVLQPSARNMCAGVNCSHVCVSTPVGFRCLCPSGTDLVDRLRCDTFSQIEAYRSHLLECGPKRPCHNGGICSLGHCRCRYGYSGVLCEYEMLGQSTLAPLGVGLGVAFTVLLFLAILGSFYYVRIGRYLRSSRDPTGFRQLLTFRSNAPNGLLSQDALQQQKDEQDHLDTLEKRPPISTASAVSLNSMTRQSTFVISDNPSLDVKPSPPKKSTGFTNFSYREPRQTTPSAPPSSQVDIESNMIIKLDSQPPWLKP